MEKCGTECTWQSVDLAGALVLFGLELGVYVKKTRLSEVQGDGEVGTLLCYNFHLYRRNVNYHNTEYNVHVLHCTMWEYST